MKIFKDEVEYDVSDAIHESIEYETRQRDLGQIERLQAIIRKQTDFIILLSESLMKHNMIDKEAFGDLLPYRFRVVD